MKRTLAIILTLALFISCTPFGALAEGGDVIELTVWHTDSGKGLEGMNAAAEKFNETIGAEKGIHVDINYVASRASGNTNTMEQLMAAIIDNAAPNIARLDNFQVASWAAQNALVPLDDLMAGAGFSLDGMYDWAREGSTYQGKTYSIPYNGDVRCLFVNLDMFEKAGLTEADIPRTIEELEAVAEKLTIEDDMGGFEQVGFIPWNNAGKPIYTWGWAFGGDFYDKENNVLTVNAPEIIEAVQWEYDFASKFGLQKFVDWANGAISGSGATDPFIAGKVAMTIKRNDELNDINTYAPDMNLAIAPIPTKDASLTTTWAGGWGWVIPRGAENQEASMEFIKFMSEEGQRIMLEYSNTLSPVKAVCEAAYAENPQFTTILEVLPYARIRPAVPVGQLLWDSFNTVLNNVLYGEGTPESELNALYEQINSELSMY